MTRELRLRPAGMLFYVVIACALVVSEDCCEALCAFKPATAQAPIYQLLVALLGLGVLVFTSEPVGYVFSSIYVFYWTTLRGRFRRGTGGYSAEWKKLSYSLKTYVLKRYQEDLGLRSRNKSETDTFPKQSGVYSADVYLSFFWQQAPERIVDWVVRRYTAFFTGMSTMIGIALALLLSGPVVVCCQLGWTSANWIVAGASAILATIVYFNARDARYEAWQMIDLWLNARLDPVLKNVVKAMIKDE